MSEFQVAKRVKSEPTGVVAGRVAMAFVLFLGGITLLGIGASDVGDVPWLWFAGGLVSVSLAFGLPMRDVSGGR